MAAKDCSGCGSTHEPPLHRRCPLRPGASEDLEEGQVNVTQASNFSNPDTLSSEQALAASSQVSDSGTVNKVNQDRGKTVTSSTETLLLRELKNISKRFNTLEEQAAKDRLVVADMANRFKNQDNRAGYINLNTLNSPPVPQVGQSVTHSVLNNVSSVNKSNQVLINGSQHNVISQMPTQVPSPGVIKLKAVQAHKMHQIPAVHHTPVMQSAFSTGIISSAQNHLSMNFSTQVQSISSQSDVPGRRKDKLQDNTLYGVPHGPLSLSSHVYDSVGQEHSSGTFSVSSSGQQTQSNGAPQLVGKAQAGEGGTRGLIQPPHPMVAMEGEDTIIPSLQALKNTQSIHDKVNKRYQELEQSMQVSPGNLDLLLETIQKKVSKDSKQKIKWPQDLAFVGSLRKRPSYDQLTTWQWLLGFLRIRQEEQDPNVKENMVEYLTELLQDACDYSWGP